MEISPEQLKGYARDSKRVLKSYRLFRRVKMQDKLSRLLSFFTNKGRSVMLVTSFTGLTAIMV